MQSGEPAQILRSILLLTANPKGTLPLRLDDEQRCIKDSLKQSDSRDHFYIHVEPAVTIPHIRRALLEHKPEIVHFCGHGAGNDGIVCKNDLGEIKLIPTVALSNLFKLVNGHVKCVVLNACFAEIQADEIVKHIDVVVGMKYSIGDDAALKFAEGFYDALFAGKGFVDCFDFGVNAIQLESIPEDSTPVIKLKEKGPTSEVKKTVKARPKKSSTAPTSVTETGPDAHEAVEAVASSDAPAPALSSSSPQTPPQQENASHMHISKKVFWGAIAAISLLIIAMSVALFGLVSRETPIPTSTEQNEIAGMYRQEIEPHKPDVDGDPNPHIKFHEIQTLLLVFFDPRKGQLQATEITFWRIYYVPDLKNADKRFLIGAYWAVWQIGGISTTGNIIKMRGTASARLGLEIESRVGTQPLSAEILSALEEDIRGINERFRSAYFEMSSEAGGKIVRYKWYNEDEKIPGKAGIKETFIRAQ